MGKKYNPVKGVSNMNKMLLTESIGYGVAGKITGVIDNPVATKAFSTGSSLAGVPSLAYAGGNVIKSLDMLSPKKSKKKGWY
jgi:hypothetical protein